MNGGDQQAQGMGRVVYVSDPSNTTALYSDPAQPDELRQWVRNLAAGGVDTYVQEVFSEAWSLFYRTELCQYDTREQHQRFVPMMDAGIVPLEVYTDEAHKQGMAFVAGFRMNDRHGHNKAFMDEHRDWVLEEFGYGLDFSVPAVCEWMLSVMAEMPERFDVDGLELNFIRWGHCFPSAAAQQQHAAMTEFVRRLRAALDETGQRKGNRLMLGVRVPQSLAGCHKLGYDVPTWVAEGLVDYVAPCDFHFTDFNARYEEFAQLAQDSDCRLYPAFQPMMCEGDQVNLMALEQYRAAVCNYYAAGADGFSVHNYQYHWAQKHWVEELQNAYPGPASMYPRALDYFNDLKNPETLTRGDRHYLFYPLRQGDGPMGAYESERVILKRSESGRRGEYRFRISEQPPADMGLPVDERGRYAGKFNLSGTIPGMWLIFRAIGMRPGDEVAIDLNGQPVQPEDVRRVWYEHGRPAWRGRAIGAYTECEFALTGPPAVPGDNYLGLTLEKAGPDGDDDIVIEELEVIVNAR